MEEIPVHKRPEVWLTVASAAISIVLGAIAGTPENPAPHVHAPGWVWVIVAAVNAGLGALLTFYTAGLRRQLADAKARLAAQVTPPALPASHR